MPFEYSFYRRSVARESQRVACPVTCRPVRMLPARMPPYKQCGLSSTANRLNWIRLRDEPHEPDVTPVKVYKYLILFISIQLRRVATQDAAGQNKLFV